MIPLCRAQLWLANRWRETGNFAWLCLWGPVRFLAVTWYEIRVMIDELNRPLEPGDDD